MARVFILLFSFSIFSDYHSLKIENENKSMKTQMQQFDHRSLIYGTIGTQERALSGRINMPTGFKPLKFHCSTNNQAIFTRDLFSPIFTNFLAHKSKYLPNICKIEAKIKYDVINGCYLMTYKVHTETVI